MSKCREAFEAECEHLGLRTEEHWYDCGSRMRYKYPEEMYPLFKAAWNARGKVDVEICKEQSIRFAEAMNRKATYGAVKCEIAIKQEQCMK